MRTADPTLTASNGFLMTIEEEPESIEEPFGVEEFRGIPAGVRDALRMLDGVDLNVVFQRRAKCDQVSSAFLERPISQHHEGVD